MKPWQIRARAYQKLDDQQKKEYDQSLINQGRAFELELIKREEEFEIEKIKDDKSFKESL